jgi:hypothetical protein
LAQAFEQIGNNEGSGLSNPIGALGSALALGFNEEAAANNVNAFLASNCAVTGEGRG